MRGVIKNIFREYNIPCDEPKKRRKSSKPKRSPAKLNISQADCTIETFSDDENMPRTYPYVQLRRSFEIPLKLVRIQRNSRSDINTAGLKSIRQTIRHTITPPEEDSSDEDIMPRPIKEEILSQQSEELQLSMPCSSVSTINSSVASTAPLIRSKISSDESSLSSGEDDDFPRSETSHNEIRLGMQSHIRSRKEMVSRYRPLDISIIRHNSMKKKVSPRKKQSRRGRKTKKQSLPSTPYTNNANSSWTSVDEEPFQTNSRTNNSFVCSSPKPSQIINTPSSTPSPRKRPRELDLMIELIEKENNSMRKATVRRSPRKSTKRCLSGGYVELYQRSLAKAKTDAKFLHHDKKYGLKNGIVLNILSVVASHGVHVAEVQNEEKENKFFIILPPQMVTQLKSNSKIEAFFDEETKPYKLETEDGEYVDIFINPHKLLLL